VDEAGLGVCPQASVNDIDPTALKRNAAMTSDRNVMTTAKTNS